MIVHAHCSSQKLLEHLTVLSSLLTCRGCQSQHPFLVAPLMPNTRCEADQHAERLCLRAQIVTCIGAAYQLKTGASPGDRFRLLSIFFLGSAELASGLSGL